MIKVRDKIECCDFLVVGGGMGGLEAAIAAASGGADVIVAEKHNTLRSGCGANGNDHFLCYIPEIHGEDMELVLREVGNTLDGGPWVDIDLTRVLLQHTKEVVDRWESYGINMRPTGKYVFEGHSLPGQQLYHLKFDGKKQKGCLTQAAKDAGARLMNHVLINEILVKDGRVAGAIGVDISEEEPEMVLFQCKAAILCAGMGLRLYPQQNPTYMFNLPGCPADVGSGHSMALRAGAKLVNIDIPNVHAGPKYFMRGGKGTWIGISSTIDGKPVTPYVTGKPSRATGDVTADVWPSVYLDKMLDGTGPVFMNCTELDDDDVEYMRWAFDCEGIGSIFEYFDQRGIDIQKEMIEFGVFNCTMNNVGVEINEKAESSLPGLYAAGNQVGNVRGNLAGAAVFGMLAGRSAAEYVKTVAQQSIEDIPLVGEKKALFSAIWDRVDGAHWKEPASTLQQIMNDYAPALKPRTENLFRVCIKYLADLKKLCYAELMAENSHEFMRCLEVLDQIDLGEAVAVTGRHRKESRGRHQRADYKFTDLTLNNKFMVVHKDGAGEYHMEYRPRHMR